MLQSSCKTGRKRTGDGEGQACLTKDKDCSKKATSITILLKKNDTAIKINQTVMIQQFALNDHACCM